MTRHGAAAATFQEFHHKALVWGSTDCIHLAAKPISLLGYEIHEALCEPYSNALGALRSMRKAGLMGVEEWLDRLVGLPRIRPEDAGPSDILSFWTDDLAMPALSVCMTRGLVLGFFEDGFCHLQTTKMDVPGVRYAAWGCEPGA